MLFVGLAFLSFLIYLSLIWFPELKHYYVPTEPITPAIIERGRTLPPEDVLQELRSHRLLVRDWRNDAQLIATADKLLKGSAEVPGLPAINIRLPFDPADLERGTSLWQLQFCGLIVPEIFIDAYRLTGREEFYDMARAVILGWANYERSAWLNRGYLWNDHATAARVRTLADFWSIYRHRTDFRPDVAKKVWTFAARTGALLAKADQFTFATNHGVMQNLGLWQLCIAFPSLPHVEEYKQIARSRFKAEFAFYVAPDGVVLEHSAEYHEFGLFLFGTILRYATLLDLDVPPEWGPKYEEAKEFYLEIRRPDGSLPPFGDTAVGRRGSAVPLTERDHRGRFAPLALADTNFPSRPFALYPVSGYAVLWDGLNSQRSDQSPSQTVLAWSYYPGHGHKHADEPSVLLWARGQEWWANAGYWPYDDPDRGHAECWEGSNAPHILNEKCSSSRKATLLSSTYSNRLFAAEMERQGPGALKIRRLVVHAPPSTWVIVDECTGSVQNKLQTIWTTGPNIGLQRGAPPGTYSLSSHDAEGEMRAYFLGPPSLTIRNFWGSRDPFAGWITLDGKPAAANAILTEQPADEAWAATVWVLDKGSGNQDARHSTAKVEWSNEDSWRIRVPLEAGSEIISRDGPRISVDGVSPSPDVHFPISETLESPPANTASQIAAVQAGYQAAAACYPRFRNLFPYRLRASIIGIALFVLQELFLSVYRRLGRTYLLTLRILAILGWASLSVWVSLFYLRVS